jgi:hypothetical protein
LDIFLEAGGIMWDKWYAIGLPNLMSIHLNLFSQVSVLLVSGGVVLSALAKPQSTLRTSADNAEYMTGILMLVASLVLSGMLGTMQEQTYQLYGPYWKEGVFYTVRSLLCGFRFVNS